LFCSSHPTTPPDSGLTDLFTSERQHTPEYPKKTAICLSCARHVIRRRGAKTLDTGRKINAAHLLWRRVAGSAITTRILMDTKFT